METKHITRTNSDIFLVVDLQILLSQDQKTCFIIHSHCYLRWNNESGCLEFNYRTFWLQQVRGKDLRLPGLWVGVARRITGSLLCLCVVEWKRIRRADDQTWSRSMESTAPVRSLRQTENLKAVEVWVLLRAHIQTGDWNNTKQSLLSFRSSKK